MLLEGKAIGGAVVGLATVFAAFEAVPSLAQDVILAAAAIAAFKVLAGSVGQVMKWGREIHAATTAHLPERVGRVEDRLDMVEARATAIEASLNTMATTERAAVAGAIEATSAMVTRPRPGRATDPGRRAG